MNFLKKEKKYSIPEYLKISKLTGTERIAYELENELNKEGVVLKPGNKIFNTMAYTLGIMLFIEKKVFASAPSTGFTALDAGAWKIVKVFQAAVFWVSLLYTLKSLLLLAVRGEGEWKKVATGFFICIGDYLAPWLFGMVPKLFNF
ncbi:hypothetical protein [Clostridium botulinum]|uniref:hypothetical protein n=1 Tax=Clostridium botulinum TaxID=1491 RepID=UPI00249F79C2|nr:hypothetical protein [Clostridium botulinum]MDU4596418.1 hypothetical protein [Clostridium sporogenes]WGZ48057.1 hypothetical protein HEQ52_18075 [Clostridium botulinum]